MFTHTAMDTQTLFEQRPATVFLLIVDGVLGTVAGGYGVVNAVAGYPVTAAAQNGQLLRKHPVCVTRLVNALMFHIWTTVPSFFGKKVEGDNFELRVTWPIGAATL